VVNVANVQVVVVDGEQLVMMTLQIVVRKQKLQRRDLKNPASKKIRKLRRIVKKVRFSVNAVVRKSRAQTINKFLANIDQ